jgi:hypothetical protein
MTHPLIELYKTKKIKKSLPNSYYNKSSAMVKQLFKKIKKGKK